MATILLIAIRGAFGLAVTKLINWSLRKANKDNIPKINEYTNEARSEGLFKAMPIVAAFSAFEATFEDFIKGIVQMHPQVFENDMFKKVKISLNELYQPGVPMEQRIYDTIALHAGREAGVGRYEAMLNLFEISAGVPKTIRDTFYASQMFRHVWAHQFGVADAQFVKNAAHLGSREGDIVSIPNDKLGDYLSVVLTYALIITSRHRALHGLDPMPLASKDAEEHAIGQEYLTLYPNARRSSPNSSA
ncbi:hypothetical protein LV457_01235 [Mycobacterium sp. MYCO198283]|uniref:hypothetical protein n=1 Tax=Mycobacterium sp. MYCO198283 TaxID=2883505 RepID=UPI001E441BB3|nr:hypothetical protein [Mycobacterium sp. MYCO198283]MCG5430923.1 hypothetical protein [Mycobacterium sp. MYCO198283]